MFAARATPERAVSDDLPMPTYALLERAAVPKAVRIVSQVTVTAVARIRGRDHLSVIGIE